MTPRQLFTAGALLGMVLPHVVGAVAAELEYRRNARRMFAHLDSIADAMRAHTELRRPQEGEEK